MLNAQKITNQLTKYMCSPTSVGPSGTRCYCRCCDAHCGVGQDGAACCIVASEDFVHEHGLENQAIEIVAQALTTDGPDAFDGKSAMDVVGYGMSKRCADAVFKQAGFGEGEGRDLVGVVELHDCFAANEVRFWIGCSAFVGWGPYGECAAHHVSCAWPVLARGRVQVCRTR